jgi:excisionase family DNA binding protein
MVYSPEEAAAVLGVCQETIYRLLKRGKLRACRDIRHKRIPHFEIERFLKASLN